jgi:serpin B
VVTPDSETIHQDPPAEASQAFALNFFRAARGHSDRNVVLSPYTAQAVLTAIQAGAAGDTLKEFQTVLGGAVAVTDEIPSPGASVDRLLMSNTLWLQSGFNVKKKFVEKLRKYGSVITPVDFSNAPEKAIDTINGTTARQTENHISNLLSNDDILPSTRLIATNAVFLKFAWANAFNEADTDRDAKFRVSANKIVTAALMHREGEFRYVDIGNAQIIDLPYRVPNYFLRILLPKDLDGLGDLEDSLTAKSTRLWAGKLQAQQVAVHLPRFKITSRISLEPVLKALGLLSVFDPNAADLSLITSDEQLYLSRALQQATIEVDEKGTTAAAATAAVAVPRSAAEGVTFRADHPFLFMVIEASTDSIVFIGRCSQPEDPANTPSTPVPNGNR